MNLDPETLPIPDFGLRCLQCGYLLAGLPRHRCPECGRLIRLDEYIPAGDFPILIFEGATVKPTDELCSLLRAYQIPYLYHPTRVEANLTFIPPTGDLGVPRERYFEAIDLLRRRKFGEPMPEPPPAADEEDWTCGGCGESNPSSFDLCWNCERERAR